MEEENYAEIRETEESDKLKNMGISTFSSDSMSEFLDK